jgi:serine/threonine protein phosphatase 1
MATIGVGDIHGNLAALNDMLDQIRGEVARGDTVVFLGDYIDRGPDTRGCIDAILEFQREVRAEVVCLLGNHEDWFLRTRRDYGRHSWLLGMEAFDTIRSYSVDAEQALRDAVSNAGPELYLGYRALPYGVFFDCVPKDHLQFFENLRSFCQTSDCLCTHGGLDPRITDVHDQAREALIWGAGGFPCAYNGAATVIYGHWNNAVLDADGWPTPMILGRTIGLDTIAHGVLSAIKLPGQQVFQSARYEANGSDV